MANAKLGRPSKEKNALLRGLVSDLLWYGEIETTEARAKSVRSVAEKLLTLAINSYEDIVKVEKEIKDDKGVKVKTTVSNDGPKKLNARRKIMSYVYDRQEQRKPKESKEVGQGGGYTRIIKLGQRRGDASEMVVIKLI